MNRRTANAYAATIAATTGREPNVRDKHAALVESIDQAAVQGQTERPDEQTEQTQAELEQERQDVLAVVAAARGARPQRTDEVGAVLQRRRRNHYR